MVIEQDVSVLFGTSLIEFMVISKLKLNLKKPIKCNKKTEIEKK